MTLLAQAAEPSLFGWYLGFGIGLLVVAVVVALVTPILLLAGKIGQYAPQINDALVESEHNTRALADLQTTIDHADVIVAGLQRGRARLGG